MNGPLTVNVRAAPMLIKLGDTMSSGESVVSLRALKLVAVTLALVKSSVLDVVLTPEPEPAVARPEDPETLADLLRRLERRNPRQRLAMVEEIEEFQSSALCELVTAKSRELEADNPAEAAEWAELARRMAELGREDRRESQGTAPSRSQESAFPGQS